MNTLKIALILLLPWQVKADVIHLKDNIRITLEVTAQPKIEVETPSSINLISSPKNNGLYAASVPIAVTLRRQESFRVSVTQPLILTRDSSVAQEFSPALIYFVYKVGTGIGAAKKELSETPETFNLAKTTSSQSRIDLLLNIYAQAPDGPDIAGQYHGQLTLLFETNS
ncbi:fimbrial protein [Yersinia enterocolitica]|uniref:fimbrial protein n=1 Tax=Yersinia enterocolitica TaxID=630 RepID=UPI0021E81D2B|nr:fimbrial protein [Yersinia enterocolitica]EKN3979517.1 fimbrial protein [Yersinia enterocolitica]EKN3983436.1 fimbrial protein [Yersinia enterocolitica]EKN5940392.1 fimbrial protein [Yersinia enterocolitica]EKN6224164.1 fimbrial protein [Yersinia enterocolitica]ELI8406123.1 fimbrial protein [Yersinia enterocolitica]